AEAIPRSNEANRSMDLGSGGIAPWERCQRTRTGTGMGPVEPTAIPGPGVACLVAFSMPVSGEKASRLPPREEETPFEPHGPPRRMRQKFTPPVTKRQTNAPNEGHLHVIVDGNYTELIVQVQTITLSLPDGAHLIRLQLVNNDHSALSPDVSRWLAVKMTHGPAGGAPSIVILSPKTGTTVGADVDVSFAVFNFAMVQPYGQTNEPK